MLGWFGFEYGWGYDKYKKAAFSSETIKVEIYLVFKCCLKLLFLRSDGQLVCPIDLLNYFGKEKPCQSNCVCNFRDGGRCEFSLQAYQI